MRPNLIYLFLACITWTACDKTGNKPRATENGKDRELLLIHYADSLILPAYTHFEQVFNQMQSDAAQFTSQPNAGNLITFRQSWVQAYIAWQEVELFDFGPADQYTLRNFFNIYPADVNGIHNNISNPGNNLEVPAAYPQQGFPALDYLLNGVAAHDTSILAYYLHPTEGSKRTAYITKVVDRMSTLLNAVISAWRSDYKSTFTSKTGLDLNASTSLMVNGLVLHYERFIRSGKIGIPSGVMLNGVPAPEKIEAFYQRDLSKTLALASHRAYVNYFQGLAFYSQTPGYSLQTYLDALEAKDQSSGKLLSGLILDAFADADSKIKLLLPDFYQQINSNNAAMKETYEAMQTVVRMLKVDMTSAMSITITYTDNDGD